VLGNREINLGTSTLQVLANSFAALSLDPNPSNPVSQLIATTQDGLNIARYAGSTQATLAESYFIASFNNDAKLAKIYASSDVTESELEYTADTHTFNGEIISNSLKSGSSAPTTNGITKVVVSDADGRLSFKDSTAIGVTSVARTNGFGISASVADPTTTPNITIGIDSASSALKSYIAQNAITSFTETAEEFTGSTSSSVTVAHTPLTSKARMVYFNGVLMNAANVAIVGTGFTISGITRATSDVITVNYSY
jgi:hypothetical protein